MTIKTILTACMKVKAKKNAWSLLALVAVGVYWCNTTAKEKLWEEDKVIVSDIKMYYTYLPSIFIYDDLKLEKVKDYPEAAKHKIWLKEKKTLFEINKQKYIKVAMGTSICYLPFFTVSHLVAKNSNSWEANGYSEPYQVGLLLSSIFFGLLGLLLIRSSMLRFVNDKVAAMVVLLLAFGTHLTFYTTYHGAYSHSYSFCLIALFFWLTLKWHDNQKWSTSVYIGLVCGLIVLIRPANIIVALLFITWGITNKASLQQRLHLFWEQKFKLLALSGAAFAVVFLQLLYWKTVLGQWVFYSYDGETFYFSNPHIYEVLFSYRKGWLLYTPIMILSVVGMFFLFKKTKKGAIAIPLFFLMHLYIISCWHSWWYGGGFGMRPMIDVYPILAIPMGVFLAVMIDKWKLISVTVLGTFSIYLVSLNLFQFDQYKKGMIHWDGMTKEAYWAIWDKENYPPDYDNYILRPNLERSFHGLDEYIGSTADFKTVKTFQHLCKSTLKKWLPPGVTSAQLLDSLHPYAEVLSIPLEQFNDTEKRYRAECKLNFYVDRVNSHEQFTYWVTRVAKGRGENKRFDSWYGHFEVKQMTSLTRNIDIFPPYNASDSLKITVQYNSGPPVFVESYEVKVKACKY
jgi:hypothetical protein